MYINVYTYPFLIAGDATVERVAPAFPTPVIPTQVFFGTPVRQIFYPQQGMDGRARAQ